MKINRNDPCPCGSGKKYKKCCLGRTVSEPAPDEMQDIMDEVRKKLESGGVSSRDEAQKIVSDFMNRGNSAPLAEFHGLSSAQMYRFLHFPFDSPELVSFADIINPPPDVPILRMLSLLVDGIGEKGLKTTATGNLPRNFCRESARAFWGEVKYENRTKIFSIRTELEFDELHCLRIVAELAGIVRKYKGKFIVTQKYRKKIVDHGIAALYPELFQVYVSQFNWTYRDGFEEIYFIQQSFLFTLYILQKYGAKTRLHTFYGDFFIKAFPQLHEEVAGTDYISAEENVQNCYTHRALHHFASFFGLIECNRASENYLDRQYNIRKLPLLDQFVSFTV